MGSAAVSPERDAPGWIQPQSAYTVGRITVPALSVPYTPTSRRSPAACRHSQGMGHASPSQSARATSRWTPPARNTATLVRPSHAVPVKVNVTDAPTMPPVRVAGTVTAASASETAM